jgi:hypothetical protein
MEEKCYYETIPFSTQPFQTDILKPFEKIK